MKVLAILLLVGSISLMAGGEVFVETLHAGPITLMGTYGVGGDAITSLVVDVSFKATNPVNLEALKWSPDDPGPLDLDEATFLKLEETTSEDISIAIPQGVLWEVNIKNVVEGPNAVQLTILKRDGPVNAALSLGGLALAGGVVGMTVVYWPNKASRVSDEASSTPAE
ncbi:MAG: hypothetical protein ACE5JC_09530 [Candidatus Zixiibacteriota bacterium]